MVDVGVTVFVGVLVGVRVRVGVGVFVEVAVGVLVKVGVGVAVGAAKGSGGTEIALPAELSSHAR